MIKELEDYNWFPSILRRWQMEFIGAVAVWTKLYKPLATVLEQIINKNKIAALHDVCSGSGISAVYIHSQLAQKIPLLLTDKYPYTAFNNKPPVVYSLHTVDVIKLQPVQNTCYTMYNTFHHFTIAQQKEIIQKMLDNSTSFLFAEILEPGVINIAKIFFTTTIVQLLAAPFVKPFSLSRLFFTYIIPVNLFTITYDGIISVLKSKTVKQYRELVKGISGQSFVITVNKINNIAGNVIYIKGEPKK